jgi:hypothetical protein
MRDVVDKAFASMDEATRNHIADMLDTAAYGGRLGEREEIIQIMERSKFHTADGVLTEFQRGAKEARDNFVAVIRGRSNR